MSLPSFVPLSGVYLMSKLVVYSIANSIKNSSSSWRTVKRVVALIGTDSTGYLHREGSALAYRN
jgi:hypothetical protein